jgi:hypothetical protein
MGATGKLEVLSGAGIATLWCLFKHGPTFDGDVPSKSGRDQLVRLGLADRLEGYNFLTSEGVQVSLDRGLDREKEKACP